MEPLSWLIVLGTLGQQDPCCSWCLRTAPHPRWLRAHVYLIPYQLAQDTLGPKALALPWRGPCRSGPHWGMLGWGELLETPPQPPAPASQAVRTRPCPRPSS